VLRRGVGALACVLERRAERCDVEDTAAVRDETAGLARGARVEDERAGRLGGADALDRRPAVTARRVVAARQDDGDGGLVGGGYFEARYLSGGRRRERGEEVAVQPRYDHLRLRVAEAAVELEHARPLRGQHQARVQQPGERRATARELGGDGPMHCVGNGLEVIDPGDRGERTHAAGVGPGVAVADALVVARRRQRDDVRAGDEREEGCLLAVEELLDERVAACARERLRQLRFRLADMDALPCSETVLLDDRWGSRLRQDAGGRHPGLPHQLLCEPLRAFDAGGVLPGPEDGDAFAAQRVGESCDERRLRADDDEVRSQLPCERDHAADVVRADVVTRAVARDPGVARRGMELAEGRARGDLPGERVLATTRADEQDPHGGELYWGREMFEVARDRP
jgi:hypothetical protein